MGSTVNVSEAVIDVLKKQPNPITIDELAFRTRTTRSILSDILYRLTRTKVVKETFGRYELNAQNEFDLMSDYNR